MSEVSLTYVHVHDKQRINNDGNGSVPDEFVKQIRKGGISLHLLSSESNASQPTYGHAGAVEGNVIVSKPEGIVSVHVKIEGILQLWEIAEGGDVTHRLCLDRTILWAKDESSRRCPAFLSFKLILPTTFSDGENDYPLPPTYEEHLPGVPGFRASVNYALLLIVNNKHNLKSTLFGNTKCLSTPFIYYPRTRPLFPLPPPLRQSAILSFTESSDWQLFEDRIVSTSNDGSDIVSKLYLPASRVFCLTEPIPFNLTFISSAASLGLFLPYGPVASVLTGKQHTKIELLRQSSVDVRHGATMDKADIWKIDCISHNTFMAVGDGPDWISFSGEIFVVDSINLGGFRASGLSVKDCIVLSMIPPDPTKCPFGEFRQVIPVQLTTNPWACRIDQNFARTNVSHWTMSTLQEDK